MLSRAISRAAWAAALVGVLLAVPAWASQVKEVRVGNHPTFTRVVIELDAPAGYRFERRELDGGASAIVVTVEAGAEPRNVVSKSVMVERIGIAAARERAVAHIRLKKSPSRVKELILTNPPRIVLDLVFPEAQLQARKAAAARRARKPAPEPVKEPKLVDAPAPPPDRILEAPLPEPVVEAPAPRAVPEREIRLEPPTPPEPIAETPLPAPARKVEAPTPPPEPVEPEPVVEAPSPEPTPDEPPPIAPESAPPPIAPEAVPGEETFPDELEPRTLARTPEPAPRSPADAEAGWSDRVGGALGGLDGGDWMTWGGGAAGVLAVLVLVVLMLRRRSTPADRDVRALAEAEADDGGAIPAEGFAMGEEPTVAIGTSTAPQAPERPGAGIAAGPGLFDDDELEKESETMDTRSTDLPVEHTASELPTQVGGIGGEGDVMRLVRDLERRVSQLETRLDESLEARERLERQVAAQSEELRVQRTAIARTQRALRSLNRGDEEQATEPALREPSK
jgi:hypothetical protein